MLFFLFGVVDDVVRASRKVALEIARLKFV